MSRVVVTGASGKAGRAVVHDLLETQPAEYERRVIAFLDQTLLNGEPTGRSIP